MFGDFILQPVRRVDLYKIFDIYKSMHGYELPFEKKNAVFYVLYKVDTVALYI